MRRRVTDMLGKACHIIEQGKPVPGKTLAKKCGLSVASVYKIIQLLRQQNIGIIPTKDGYLLSNSAEKKHVVGWTRRLLSRRTFDAIAVSAAYNDMIKMWYGEDRTKFMKALSYIRPRETILDSIKFTEQKSERLGI